MPPPEPNPLNIPDAAAIAAPAPAPERGLARLRQWFQDGLLRRVFRNASILLSGKTLAGLLSLGALAVTARALGPELFGILILIENYMRLVTGLAKFQSWQAVIHFGAHCLEQDRRRDLQGLIRFTTLLDVASAVLGTGVAVAVAPIVGPWLGWGPEVVPLAMLYSVMILFTLNATPTGILRLFDRFDLLATQSVVTPALRLVGVCGAYLADAGLGAFLLVWLVSGVVGRLVLLGIAWREFSRQGLMAGMSLSLRRLVKPHPGLWRFVWSTNFSTSLNVLSNRGRTLAVGWVLDPAAAGLFAVAREFADIIHKPVMHLGHVIYPDLAKLSAQDGLKSFRRLMVQSGLVAGTAVTLVLAVLIGLGKPILALTVGDAYLGAYGVFVLLALASAIRVFAFPLRPALVAAGRPHVLLRVQLVLAVLFFALLLALLWRIGLIGAGIAAIAVVVAEFGVLTIIVRRWLNRQARLSRPD